MPLKLHYFAGTGRAEASRCILAAGKIPFEDVTVSWPEFKGKTPLGQVPVLELEDGRMLAQSGAIERYVAKLAGLYPEDPLTAAYADQAIFLIDDIGQLLYPTFAITDLEARIRARQELMAGKLKEKFELLAKLLEGKEYVAGNKLSYADIGIYTFLSSMKSGAWDGISTTFLDDLPPVLKAHRNKIANIPEIKARYANAEGNRLSFKPE